MSGAADWELEYPTIVGDSSRGGLFEPKEIAGELMMQFFGKNGNAHWEPVWVEMNGHVLHVYTQKADLKPAVRFDLKEVRVYPAVKGLPGKEINTKAPLLGVVSRYHRVVLTDAVSEVPPTSIFFFECQTEEERDNWLRAFYINYEWAQRFSGLFYPRGTARVEYQEGVWKTKVCSDNTVRYLKSSRLHVSAKIDGPVYKKGSKFASAWKLRYAALKGTCTLEYYTEKGGESLGKLNMADGRVVLVCNDTLTPPTGTATKEKLSSLKGKITRRTSVAVPVDGSAATSKEDRLENLLWFAIVSPARVWMFRAVNLEDLERWMYSMEDRCNEFKQQMQEIKMAIQQAEKSFDNDPCPIRYKNHPLKETGYPQLERAAIPGRPMSGQFSSEDAVRARADSEAAPVAAPPQLKKTATSAAVMSSRGNSKGVGGGAAGTGSGATSSPAVRKRAPSDVPSFETLDSFDADLDALGASRSPRVPAKPTSPSPARRAEDSGSVKSIGGSRSPRGPAAAGGGGPPGKPLPGSSPRRASAASTREDESDLLDGLDDDLMDEKPKKALPPRSTRTPASSKGDSVSSVPAVPGKRSASSNSSSSTGDAEEALKEKIAALESLQKQFGVLKEEFQNRKAKDKEKDKEIERLKSELEEAKSNAGGSNEATEAELEDTKTKLKNEAKKTAKLEQEVKKLKSDNERLASQAGSAKDAEEASKEVEELRAQLESQSSETEKLEQQVDELKKQLKEASRVGGELEREKKKRELAERKLQEQEESAGKVEEELESLKNDMISLEDQLARAKKQASDAEAKLQQQVQQASASQKGGGDNKALLQQVANLEAKLAAAESEARSARTAAAVYAQKNVVANVSDSNVREVVKALNAENDELLQQVAALRAAAASDAGSADVKALRKELVAALKQLEAAQDKIRAEAKAAASNAPPSGGGGGGGNPAAEKRLRDEINQLNKDKKELAAQVEELKAEIVLHLQDKEQLAKAFEEMQLDGGTGGGDGHDGKEEEDPFAGVPNEEEEW